MSSGGGPPTRATLYHPQQASSFVIPVLPKGTTGILGVGRTDADMKSNFVMTICHATCSGVEGSFLMTEFMKQLGQ